MDLEKSRRRPISSVGLAASRISEPDRANMTEGTAEEPVAFHLAEPPLSQNTSLPDTDSNGCGKIWWLAWGQVVGKFNIEAPQKEKRKIPKVLSNIPLLV